MEWERGINVCMLTIIIIIITMTYFAYSDAHWVFCVSSFPSPEQFRAVDLDEGINHTPAGKWNGDCRNEV